MVEVEEEVVAAIKEAVAVLGIAVMTAEVEVAVTTESVPRRVEEVEVEVAVEVEVGSMVQLAVTAEEGWEEEEVEEEEAETVVDSMALVSHC